MPCDLVRFLDGARYFTGGQSINLIIITLLVGRILLLTAEGLLRLLVRKGWSNALFVISLLINWPLPLFRDSLLGRWLNWRRVVAWNTALTPISLLE